jgi:hypothetical protein
MSHRAVTSAPTDVYNCIAWAMDDQTRFWWPNGRGYWPGRRKGEELQPTLEVFCQAFKTRGYDAFTGPAAEVGFEKVALYSKGNEITHAAKQLASGFWSSKLGQHVDIEHELQQIEGAAYGTVRAFLRRPARRTPGN